MHTSAGRDARPFDACTLPVSRVPATSAIGSGRRPMGEELETIIGCFLDMLRVAVPKSLSNRTEALRSMARAQLDSTATFAAFRLS